MSKANYVLESSSEFERLEKQSQNDAYDCSVELSEYTPKKNAIILDAGCGSGLVSRYLAETYSHTKVTGADFSEDRVRQAREHSKGIKNLNFQTENLNRLSFDHSHFDTVVCRYVLEHLSKDDLPRTLREFYRCLRPNGKIVAIDVDGFIYNLFPQTELVSKVIAELIAKQPLDMHIGRKLPHFMVKAGFENITWRIDTQSFQGERLQTELQLIKERFDQAMPFLISFLGSEETAKKFVKEYFESANQPGAVLYFNKFVVTGEKPGLRKV